MSASAAALRHPALVFVLLVLVWGSTWLVIKDQVGMATPGWTISWRFLIASAGMVALALVRGDSLRLPRGAAAIAAFVGITQFCGNFQFVYRAEQHLTSGVVAVLYALLLVPNTLLARALLGERVTGRFIGGSAVAIGGIALLLLHELDGSAAGGTILAGVGLTLAGLFCASLANVTQMLPAARQVSPVSLIAHAMLWGTLADIALALALDGPPGWETHPRFWAGVAYLAIPGSVLTFPLYFALIRRIGAGPAAYNTVVIPVVAMLLSTLFEHYRWTLLAAAGCLLVLAGLALALSGRSNRPAVPPPE